MLSIPRGSPVAFPALLALALAPACVIQSSRSSLASDTSGAEDVAGTESDVESLGTSLVGSNGQSVATASLEGAGTVRPLDNTVTGSNVAERPPAGARSRAPTTRPSTGPWASPA
ncbi:MAG TPA: hypothetical protein VK762_19515 [Polyangiaceae bacterium]|nr:hypothetical protein [Polyangiaceae bacterium]